ncbi:hypothetical protein JZ968_06640 [Riemerella anatipestifer]
MLNSQPANSEKHSIAIATKTITQVAQELYSFDTDHATDLHNLLDLLLEQLYKTQEICNDSVLNSSFSKISTLAHEVKRKIPEELFQNLEQICHYHLSHSKNTAI